MRDENLPWTNRFSPECVSDIAGNEKAVEKLKHWILSWENNIPKNKAAFLYGPPGVGKTCSVIALAKELDYDLFEINASDHRTKKRLEDLIGRAIQQTMTITGKRRIILFDELEGVSGQKDRGGINTIVSIIKETRVPVILIATSTGEKWEEKFRPLVKLSLLIGFKPVNYKATYKKLKNLTERLGFSVDMEVLEYIAEHSQGDLRSAINDLETIARGKEKVTLNDVKVLKTRDRKDYTPDALMKMFSAKTLREARKIISSSHINYDTLFDWIYENLPLFFDDEQDLFNGLEALSRADIYQTRARRTQNYRLLKYMFNEMTGGVTFSRKYSRGTDHSKIVGNKLESIGFPKRNFQIQEAPEGIMIKPYRYLGNDWRHVNTALNEVGARWVRGNGCWLLPYFQKPQLIWRYRRTWSSRHRRMDIAEKVAEKCHISRKMVVSDVMPYLKIIYQESEYMGKSITDWLNLEDKEVEWLKS